MEFNSVNDYIVNKPMNGYPIKLNHMETQQPYQAENETASISYLGESCI